MFENVLGQDAVNRLIGDIEGGVLASAMLFSGPPASGKGTAALELGRVISCEAGHEAGGGADGAIGAAAWNSKAPWGCGCSACSRHRLLIHPDLLCLGWKSFSAEISASAGAFLRDESAPVRMLFIRSVRKLLARFNPVLWDDEPKRTKIFPLAASLEEDLDELGFLSEKADGNIRQLVEGMLKNAFKLESEGISETVPINQIRRAAWWSRLAPAGRGKLLLIENADRMQEEARNSLLKLLEEPPGNLRCVLTTTRPGSLPSTILSRLRPYRFNSRDASVEDEVIRRVFRDKPAPLSEPSSQDRIEAYLDSFLPVSNDTLEALAAFFASSAAYKAALLCKRRGRAIPEEVVLLGQYSAPRAEVAGFGRPRAETSAVIELILEKAEKFEIRSLFTRFISCLLENASRSLRQAPNPFLPSVSYNEIWSKTSLWAENAVRVYNLRPAQVLEKIFADLSRGMAEL